MNTHRSGRTVVVGIGSLIRGDDGVGLSALELLEKDPRRPPGVEFVDGSVLGLAVIGLIQDASRLLFLDAVDVGAEPGTVVRLKGQEIMSLPSGSSPHDIGISGLLSLLGFLGGLPEEVVLVGIQPGSIALGGRLSPEVEAGLVYMVADSIRQLNEWRDASGQYAGLLQS